jgi:aspartate-semialdehyde dehydrogenase
MGLNVGIVGATGMVGEVFLELLSERNFPVEDLRLFASENSKGQTRDFKNKKIPVQVLAEGCFKGLDLVFFSSGDDISKEWAPKAVADGAYAIDNSGAFRMHDGTSLVVPEVNGHLLEQPRSARIIANPNCSTIQLVVALSPLMSDFGLESVHVASYQAVSGAGKAGQDELMTQTKALAAEKNPPAPQTFPHVIAMNAVPQIGSFNDQGFCSEEVKIMNETKKILGRGDFRVSAFTVRIPAWNAHSEAVWVRLKKSVTRDQVISSLKKQNGLVVEDGAKYPTAAEYDGKDPVAVGRIHQDPEDPQTWMMWVVADNLRKGAALNGIQIAERIFDIN